MEIQDVQHVEGACVPVHTLETRFPANTGHVGGVSVSLLRDPDTLLWVVIYACFAINDNGMVDSDVL